MQRVLALRMLFEEILLFFFTMEDLLEDYSSDRAGEIILNCVLLLIAVASRVLQLNLTSTQRIVVS